jgi:hypothetical protein
MKRDFCGAEKAKQKLLRLSLGWIEMRESIGKVERALT